MGAVEFAIAAVEEAEYEVLEAALARAKPMQWRLREPEADQWRGGARYRPAGWRCEPHRERVVFISN